MFDYKKHLFQEGQSLRFAMQLLDDLAPDAVLFVINSDSELLGTLTDGDIRRGIIAGKDVNGNVEDFIHTSPTVIHKGDYQIQDIINYRSEDFKLVPVLNEDNKIVNIINFRFFKSYLPVDAVIMAGGRGERLKPLTDNIPKPLLKVGDKPIIEHNIERLLRYGIDDFWISVRYLGHQIKEHFKDGSDKGVVIKYIFEEEPLGTLGAVSAVDSFQHDYILVSNSDLLTNIDYEDFFLDFLKSGAELSVVTIPYSVAIPYAVLETDNGQVLRFKEKPTYTYYSNGGIYLLKKSVIGLLPKNQFFNATDLMELLIMKGMKVNSYPLRGYWLDIGKHEDYKKAQEDIKHIIF